MTAQNLKPFRAICRKCRAYAFLTRAQSWFYCMNCGFLNKARIDAAHNPKNICSQCGYYFGYEPADYCKNPVHRMAFDQAKAEHEAAQSGAKAN